jgi:hypothetical protein
MILVILTNSYRRQLIKNPAQNKPGFGKVENVNL